MPSVHAAQDPWLERQHQPFSPGPSPIMAVSITNPYSAFRKRQQALPAPRGGWHNGSASLGGWYAWLCSHCQGAMGFYHLTPPSP